MTGTDNIVWKTVCLAHIVVVFAGIVYVSIIVIELMLQQMKNPLRHEEGRCVFRGYHTAVFISTRISRSSVDYQPEAIAEG